MTDLAVTFHRQVPIGLYEHCHHAMAAEAEALLKGHVLAPEQPYGLPVLSKQQEQFQNAAYKEKKK